jgi:4-amino-4-deoxy-L-arabinose transferase-like glycosyltransferase
MGSNKRTLAIVGASVLMLGFFLPVVTFLGFLSWSYFDLLTKVSVRFITGLFIFALGALSLLLALKNNFKPLIVTGVLALAILAFDFITYKRAAADLSSTGGIGTATGGGSLDPSGQFVSELAGIVIQPAWGMFIMVAGAIVLIVAGAMKDKTPASGPDWNRNPPPPMNYS